MFNPNSYRDTDFGLEHGESFEPEDADAAPVVDLSQPHVMTVLGPIEPDELGVCLTHEHLLSNPAAPGNGDPDDRLDHLERAAEELEAFALTGGRSIVDATTPDAGRNAAGLYELAQRVPLHIIATTGPGARRQPNARPGGVDVEAMAASAIQDLTEGMDGTPAKAGIISVGSATNGSVEGNEASYSAAATCHLATGAPLAVQLGDAGSAHASLDLLQRHGVATDRVILQHLDHVPSVEALIDITERGVWCSFDQIGKRDSEADAATAETIVDLFARGYGDALLISQGLDRKSQLSAYGGGPGLTYLLEWFTLALMEAGAEAAMVRRLLIENPLRALSIVPMS